MDAARWRTLNELFYEVTGRPPGERHAWLDVACAGDRALHDEVDRLVRAHEHARSFMATTGLAVAMAPLADDGDPPIGLDFPGTEHFAVLRSLGVGGMGIVYEVHDRVRNEIVALKTLLRVNAAEIYRLKREFRSLADVAHLNLVSLYELYVEGEYCFFTMERVTGVTFVDHARGPRAWTTLASSVGDRVRYVFPQLVNGLSELHRQGKIHRDIKPSNVLVTPEQRVVILDFGLITELSSQNPGAGERMAGTPAYMSPEQTLGGGVSEASDWYSVGVMLYEALTGHVPFAGTFAEVFRPKTESDPPAPAMIAPDIPEDLNSICMGLLCRDPTRRLSGVEAVSRLGRGAVVNLTSAATRAHIREAPFVGRVRQLDVLNEAFGTVRQGRAAVVYVSGPSGIGKTALVRCFLDRLVKHEDVVLLSGRCYERESVPYKALDGVVDSLSHYLTSLPRSVVEGLMPPDAPALSRLFPVLKRVNALVTVPRWEQDIADPLILRRRAIGALRELLARLADRQRLVIFIDDLHWADADSAALLEDLLRPPHSPAVLAVACCRSEEIGTKPFLGALLEQAGSGNASTLLLGPMDEDEAGELIASLIPDESSVRLDDRRKIAREADGNPFFLDQLARYVILNEVRLDDGPTLAEMIESRLRGLTPGARHFLETLATCGRPMTPSLVYGACGLEGDERPLVALLRTAHLVRSSGSAERVEIYHDRIREALAAQIAPASMQRIHRVMAQTLVSRRIDDPDALFEHYRGAGDDDSAATHAALAARKANAALAFDRAAMFYRHALELTPLAGAHNDWKEALATALANAGRPAEAGEVYLEAAAGAEPAQRVELQRRGAEQFLIGGHIGRGLDAIRTVLDTAGMRLGRGPRMAVASMLFRRAQLRWRGLTFIERDADRAPAEDLLRVDACWSVVTGLALVDNVRACDYNTRHLLLALEVGEPNRIARALAVEAIFSAMGGGRSRQRTAEFAERARVISERVGHPHAIALSTLMAGVCAGLIGEFGRAAVFADRALGILRDRCVGVTWELNAAHNSLLGSLLYLGEYREVSRRLPSLMTGAQDSGNLYIQAELRTRMMTLVWLAADEPDEAERQANEVMDRWSHKGFYIQHYRHIQARTMTALYRGDGEGAWRLFAENRAALRRSLMLRMQLLRIEASYLRGRCALAAAVNRDRRSFLSIAQDESRRIAREKMPWSNPLALLLSSAVAYMDGNTRVAEPAAPWSCRRVRSCGNEAVRRSRSPTPRDAPGR